MTNANRFPFLGSALLGTFAAMLVYVAVTQGRAGASSATPIVAEPATETALFQDRSFATPAPRPDVFYEAITERPLFAPARRPTADASRVSAPVPAVVPKQEPTIPVGWRLTGILGGDGNRSALIAAGGGEADWFREDDQIEGWTVRLITDSRVTLSAGDAGFDLELFE